VQTSQSTVDKQHLQQINNAHRAYAKQVTSTNRSAAFPTDDIRTGYMPQRRISKATCNRISARE